MSGFAQETISSGGGGGVGDASAANQLTEISRLASIESLLGTLNSKDFSTETTLATLNGKITTVNTGAVVISSSVLPTGASTSAHQVTELASLSSIDGKLTTLNSKDFATSAKQDTAQTTLDLIRTDTSAILTNTDHVVSGINSIDSKIPTLGQALASGSVPVVLTALQLSTLTPPAAITGFATESTLNSLNNKIPLSSSLSDTSSNPTTFSIDSKISGYNGSSWDRIRTGLLAQTSSPIGFLNSIPFAQYNFANLSLLDTETAPLQITDAGFLRSEEQMAPLYESSIGRAVTIDGPTNSGLYAHDPIVFSEVHLGTISAGFANLLSFSI
jgi:hypothetical protein